MLVKKGQEGSESPETSRGSGDAVGTVTGAGCIKVNQAKGKI